jgi:hypothetical protein
LTKTTFPRSDSRLNGGELSQATSTSHACGFTAGDKERLALGAAGAGNNTGRLDSAGSRICNATPLILRGGRLISIPNAFPGSLDARIRLAPRRLCSCSKVVSCNHFFGVRSGFTHVTACTLAESPTRPFASKAPTALLPPLPIRLLPGGANQFPGSG